MLQKFLPPLWGELTEYEIKKFSLLSLIITIIIVVVQSWYNEKAHLISISGVLFNTRIKK